MAMDDSTMETTPEDDLRGALRGRAMDGGRLSVYAALGALTGAVPLPWVPASLARRVRGALVHDVAARHGLSLTKEARDILSAPPGGETSPRGIVLQAAAFVGRKVVARFASLSPLGVLVPVRAAVATWALGYLFDRYLETGRRERAVRIDAGEARRVRDAIDRAVVHALTAEPRPEEVATAPEELRDTTTQLIDGVLGAAAAVPGWLVRRLDAAFDELLPEARG
jgi:plasmid stability protein